ncbi:D-alanyl-D-alanine carboxypeptidase [Amylibacter sp. SFDW26]|uniref:serine hydrolase n=1 Tax=Amylibacter sp. SFDW26 TaxID=2652722 RepID=UPI001261F1E8|nr:serine hydrolase [Amylibacter sp. SFDW26]KAB7614005.1 D-alanyl-D-alanine carboxypeptidase [Amylibacter sp. SFDW26]
MVVFLLMNLYAVSISYAAPYAAMVMDARTGQVVHSRNADTRLHPASLTKMMTLYVVFQAIERGELSLTKKVRISKHAASEPPSKLGLKAGQRIELKYLIRGAAVKSANDAATALGEAVSGSEAAFARRMTATAKRLGMKSSTFKNAHGLTQSGHLSTARDMTLLGRRLFYDYPQYYNLFSRRSTDAGVRQVANTNRKLLGNYRGADGIKTGYTNAAGFNLVASAERGSKRVIATVFGGKTSSSRNARVAQLLDLGFGRVNPRLAERKPTRIAPVTNEKPKIIKVVISGAVRKSPIPKMRVAKTVPTPEPVLVAAVDQAEVEAVLKQALAEQAAEPIPAVTSPKPVLRPTNIVPVALVTTPQPVAVAKASTEPRVVSRKSTSGRVWSVQLGAYGSKFEAEKTLLTAALSNLGPLEGASRRIAPATVNGARLYRARFVGLSQADANKACSRLRARSQTCVTVSPGS